HFTALDATDDGCGAVACFDRTRLRHVSLAVAEFACVARVLRTRLIPRFQFTSIAAAGRLDLKTKDAVVDIHRFFVWEATLLLRKSGTTIANYRRTKSCSSLSNSSPSIIHPKGIHPWSSELPRSLSVSCAPRSRR